MALLLFLVSFQSLATTLPLEDVAYQFDQQKLNNATDMAGFFGSFADYYYLLMQKNKVKFQSVSAAWATSGWCVGDAHIENFGVLLQKSGEPLFTMNDMDDAGPCPVALDIFRLLVSARLYDKKIDVMNILTAYEQGLDGQSRVTPQVLQSLKKKAQLKGRVPDPKKVNGNKLIRNATASEVSQGQFAIISQVVSTILMSEVAQPLMVLDMIATRKVGGGSGGLLRYEILINNNGTLLHIELKTEVMPSIYPVATSPIPETTLRIANTLEIEQGDTASHLYGVVLVDNNSMLIRPRFAGNLGVKLSQYSNSESQEIIVYEAYTLGLIHARSVGDVATFSQVVKLISSQDLVSDVATTTQYLEDKYAQLMGQ